MKSSSRSGKIYFCIGVFFILVGIIMNELVLSHFFSTDNILTTSTKVTIRIFNFIFILMGGISIYFRYKLPLIFINILISLFTFLLLFVVGEIILRAIETKNLSLFISNPHETGSYRLKPSLDIIINIGSKKFTIRTNSFGMRWHEISKEKQNNVKRIAFIGDSYTFGAWADKVENSFVGVFNSLLYNNEFEVLNFGVGGYGLHDMKLQIEEEILQFDVDYLVLMVFNGNDFRDTYLGVNKYVIKDGVALWDTINFNQKIPFIHHKHKIKLVDISVKDNFLRYVKSFVIYQRINSLLIKNRSDNQLYLKKYHGFSPSHIYRDYSFWSQKNYPEVAINSKREFLLLLSQIFKICNKNNIKLIICSIPYSKQVYTHSEIGSNYNINFPQRYVEEFSTDNKIPYFDLLIPLRNYVRNNEEPLYLAGHDHFNNIGHKFVGKLLYEYFKENINK